MLAIPVLSALLLTPSTPVRRRVKNGIFQPGEVYLAQGASQSPIPGKIRVHGPRRLWMLGEVEEWGTLTAFFYSVI